MKTIYYTTKQMFLLAVICLCLILTSHKLHAQCPSISDDFETGTFATPPWDLGTGHTVTVDTVAPAEGTYSMHSTGSSAFYSGLDYHFTGSQPTYVSWWIKTNNTAATSGYFILGDDNITSNNGIIFCYCNNTSNIRFFNTSGVNYPITVNTWYHVECKNIDWTNKNFDIYINGVLWQTDFAFRTPSTTAVTQLQMFNLSAATASYDKILVGDNTTLETPTIAITGTVNDSLNVCGGTSVTLTAMANDTMTEYLWYKNGTAINYALSSSYTISTPSVASTDLYTVAVAYNGFPCLSPVSAPATIIIHKPTATIAGSPTTFCANNPTTLQANTGTNYTYQWKRSNINVGTNASTYTPTLSGNHNVTITDSMGCSKTSSWTNIIINALPNANAGLDKNPCMGTATQIGTTNNVAYIYQWSPTTNLSNPNISNPMATPTTSTQYIVTVMNATTLCTKTDTVNVNPLALPDTPTLSSTSTPVCQGTSIILTPTSVGPNNIWYKNGITLYTKPATTPVTLTAASPTADSYTIRAKDANNCLSSPSNIINAWIQPAPAPTITSNPAAVANIVSLCSGTTADLTANSTAGSPTYSWKLNGAYIAGANTNQYTNISPAPTNKVFSVVATYDYITNTCVKTSTNTTIKLQTNNCRLASDKDNANENINETLILKAYPNPTNDILHVEIMNFDKAVSKLIIYNTLAQVVLEKEISFILGQVNIELDISSFSAGVYSLSFENQTQKIIKE